MFDKISQFLIDFNYKFRITEPETLLVYLSEIYILFLVTVPLSLLLFLIFSRNRTRTLVDLGFHKWLIKD